MKTKSVPLASNSDQKVTIGAVLEWTLLSAALLVGVYLFLKGFGFISVNDLQAFPP